MPHLPASAALQRFRVIDLTQVRAGADAVVANCRPDVKFRLGIDYESLVGDNPGRVHAGSSGFGQTGPRAARSGGAEDRYATKSRTNLAPVTWTSS